MAIKLLTYNLWHGLSGRGFIKMSELEPRDRPHKRTLRQIELLDEIRPDIIFLQEVNPLHEKLPLFMDELNLSGEGQSDLCGVKLQFLGPPFNLNSGIALLARPNLNFQRVTGLKLSGPLGIVGSRFAFQLQESRFALICEAQIPQLGRILLVCTHLHHGFELTPSLRWALEDLVSRDVISWRAHSEILASSARSVARRDHELDVLFSYLEKIQLEYDGLILAGDLNVDPDSPMLTRLTERGLVDLAANQDLWSWDRSRNEYNMELNEAFELPLPDFNNPQLRQVIHDHMFRKTRLDYIFASRNLAVNAGKCRLVGDLPEPELIPSDHFGVLAQLC